MNRSPDLIGSRLIFRIICACAVVLMTLPSASSQQTPGTIKGTVTDQLRGLIVSATVIATDSRGVERKTTTSSSGVYEFKALPQGNYDLRVVAPGFSVTEEKNVEVRSGRSATVDLQLNIESLEQSVTVDNKGVSTDSDQNADALILRERAGSSAR